LDTICFLWAAPSVTDLELNALHPWSCEGRCTAPSDCEDWFESSHQWSAHRAKLGEGISSKDGLHHIFLKPTTIATVQAVLSLSLASMGNCNFDVSWLDDLPAADDSKLHCGLTAVYSFANTRVLIAEVLEWQGRNKEAIRCENLTHFFVHASAHPFMCVTCVTLCSIAALLLPNCKRTSTSAHRRRCVQGGCLDDVMRRWGSTRFQCQHSTRLSSWQVSGASCYQLSEALAIRDRVRAGQAAGGSRAHWDEHTGKQRLGEMMGRMQGPREPLERLLALPS
jgi:hypothetical protein